MFLRTTNVIASDEVWNPEEPDFVLSKGEQAPFRGVLISPVHYKAFTIDHLENDSFKKHMDEIIKCDPPPLLTPKTTASFIAGIFLGILATTAIAYTIHH